MGIFCGRKKSLFSSNDYFIFPLLFSLILSRFSVVISLNYTKYRQVSTLRIERIQKHIDNINKPSVITIQSPDGDIIDCVHRKKQPAFDHPLLKNHKIQKEPPKRPKITKVKRLKTNNDKEETGKQGRELEWQMWHLNGTRCPKGTIPIRRSTIHDVLRAKSLYDFGKKRPKSIPSAGSVDAPYVNGYGHEHAIAYTERVGEIYGAKATINVWDPNIEEINELSLSQIWLLNGNFDGSDLNSIEAGWQSG